MEGAVAAPYAGIATFQKLVEKDESRGY